MDKGEIWDLYQWIRRRLTEDERKLIQAIKPNLLIATEREFAIHLKSKIILILKIIGDPESFEKTRN